MGQYKNIKRFIDGHIFMGYPIVINGEKRIWDAGTVGMSYPEVDCIPWA